MWHALGHFSIQIALIVGGHGDNLDDDDAELSTGSPIWPAYGAKAKARERAEGVRILQAQPLVG